MNDNSKIKQYAQKKMIKGEYEGKSFTSIGNLQLNIFCETLLIFLCFKFQ